MWIGFPARSVLIGTPILLSLIFLICYKLSVLPDGITVKLFLKKTV